MYIDEISVASVLATVLHTKQEYELNMGILWDVLCEATFAGIPDTHSCIFGSRSALCMLSSRV